MRKRGRSQASLGVAGALVAGLVITPIATNVASAAGSNGPAFSRITAHAVGSHVGADGIAARSAGTHARQSALHKTQLSKSVQVLQSIAGISGVGYDGVATAAGPKQVVEAGGIGAQGVVRAYAKNTGKQVASKTTNQFFGLAANAFDVSQPTVAYDPIGKRFVAAAITDDDPGAGTGDVGVVIRVSKSSAATPFTKKKWHKSVGFASAAAPTEEPGRSDVDESRPALGVSGDKVAVTVVATDPNDASVSNRLFFFPKGPLYNGSTSPGGFAASVDNTYDGQRPAVNQTKQNNLFIAIPDTNDVTVTTYTGPATKKAPSFSKNVVYPSKPLTAPPLVPQFGGDTIDLGGLSFTGVSWRANRLYAAATTNCGGLACIRLFGINTGSGVSLASDPKPIKSNTADWFSPAVAPDAHGNLAVTATDVGTKVGPSQVVLFRKSNGKLTKPRFIRAGNANANGPGATIDWFLSNSAAADPTSHWDVWVAGASGSNGTSNGLTTRVARVSLAKNVATLKASDQKVKKGSKVTFTLKLKRPDSKDAIKGLPVALQKRPLHGGKWNTVKSGKTSPKGSFKVKLKIKKNAKYQTLGKKVGKPAGNGRLIDSVKSKSVTVKLK